MCADPCTKQKRATRIIEQKKKKIKIEQHSNCFPFPWDFQMIADIPRVPRSPSHFR